MADLSVERTIQIAVMPTQCVDTFKSIIERLDKYQIKNYSPSSNMIEVDKKASFLQGGYGERILFCVRTNSDGLSDVKLTVSPKGLPYALWQKNCTQVIQTLTAEFDREIQKYVQEIKTQGHCNSVCSAADELKKFKELLDLGIITQEEFDAKKKQLLGL